VTDFLDWLDGAKLGILATATVAIVAQWHQARQAQLQRSHERNLEGLRLAAAELDKRRELYARYLAVAYRLVGAWYQLATAPPRTDDEHNREFERREPLHAGENQALAEIRIVADEAVVDAAETVHGVVLDAGRAGQAIVDYGRPFTECWPPVDTAMMEARERFVLAVRGSLDPLTQRAGP
jgi:hypothetical protein